MKHSFTYFRTLFLLAAMVLGTHVNVWGNTATLNGTNNTSSAITSTSSEASFLISNINGYDGAYDFLGDKHCAGWKVAKNTNAIISWTVSEGYSIDITSVTVTGNAGGDKKAFDVYTSVSTSNIKKTSGNSNTATAEVVTLNEYDTYFKGIGNNGSITLQHGNTVLFLNNITITYTLTPNTPTIIDGQEFHSIMAAIPGGDNQEVDLKNVFSRVDAGHTSLEYECNSANSANATISNGFFSASVAGDYTVRARIVAQADCHEASAWSDNITIHVEERASKEEPTVSKNFAANYFVDDAAIDLSTLWTSPSDGAITYSITSFEPSDISAGATTPVLTDGHILSLGQAGTLHLSFNQAEGSNYLATEDTYNLVISKRNPNFTQELSAITANKIINVTDLYSTESDQSVTVSSLDENMAKVINDQIYFYDQTGDVHFSVAQAGNYKWEEVSELDFTIAISAINTAATSWCWKTEIPTDNGVYYLYTTRQERFLYDGQTYPKNSYSGEALSVNPTVKWTFSGSIDGTFKLQSSNNKPFAVVNQNWDPRVVNERTGENPAIENKNITVKSALESPDGKQYSLYTNERVYGSNRNVVSTSNIRLEIQADASYEWLYISENQYNAYDAYTTLTDYVGTKTVSAALKDVAVETLSANDCESAIEYDQKAENLQAVIDAYDAYADVEEYIANSSAPAEKIAEANAALAVSTTTSEILAIKSMLKLEPDFAYNGGTLKVDATSSFVLTNVDVETLDVAITNNTPTGITDGSEHADEIIAYDKATNTIYAYNAGTAHIVLRQPETDALYADEAEFDITVEKYTNTITLDGTTNYNVTLSYNDSKTLTLASDNAAVAIAAEQTSGTDKVAFAGDALTVTSNYRDGAAAIAVSQAEDYKYAAAAATINVTVAAGTDPVCYVLEFEKYKADIGGNQSFELAGPGEKMLLNTDRDGTETGSGYIELTVDGSVWTNLRTFSGNDKVHNNLELPIAEDVTAIKFGHKDGISAFYFKDVKVTRKNFVRTDKSELVTPVALISHPVVATFDLQYSTSEGDYILLVSENPKFALSTERVSTAACSQGVETITVTYTSDVAGTDNGNIIIYNHSHRFVLPVSGTTRPKLQTHIVYVGKESYSESEAYDSDNNLLGVPNPFRVYDENDMLVEQAFIYTESSNTNIIDISNSTLVPHCGGEVTITASYEGDDTYAAAANIEQTISTDLCEATFDWEQTFRGFTSPTDINKEETLIPVLHDKDGNELNATFGFITGNAEVATIINDNTLKMIADGRTTITANATNIQADSKGRSYAETSLTKEVRMRPFDAPCESYLVDWNGSKKAEASTYAEWTWKNPTGDLIDTDRDASFSAHISFWATRGTFKTYQQVDGEWAEVRNSGRPGQNTTGIVTCRLAANATGFRVEFSGIGLGSCTVYDLNVPMKTYMTADKATIEASKDIDKTYLSEIITVTYSDIPQLQAEITQFATTADGETGTLTIAPTQEALNDCGDFGSHTYQISGTFIKEGEVTANVHFYTAADAIGIVIPVTLTITGPDTYDPGCTDCNITWDGSSRPNFEDEVHLSDNVNVIVTGDVTVKGLTIDEGSSVTITVNGHLTIEDAPSVEQNAYGDLIIEKGGWITINGSGTTQVRNIEFNTALGDRYTAAQSAQLELADDEYLNVNGDMYIDITFDPNALSYGWYDFTVPFPVSATNGIFYADAEGNETQLIYGEDYLIQSFSESLRAEKKKAWANYRGIMQPCVGYTITIDYEHAEWNTLRFKKTNEGSLNLSKQTSLVLSQDLGEVEERGWNCLGNGTTTHASLQIAGVEFLDVYDHSTNSYVTLPLHEYNFVVGSAFRIQATTDESALYYHPISNDHPLRAPAHNSTSHAYSKVEILHGELMDDVLFLSASDDALPTYEAGRDLLKEGKPSDATVAQMWCTAYDNQLSVVNLPTQNLSATFPVQFYAPKTDSYTLRATPADDEVIYLLRNGMLYWNLSLSPCSIQLNRGTDAQYSLLMVKRVGNTATELLQTASAAEAEKILLNDQLFILYQGQLFDMTGHKITNK